MDSQHPAQREYHQGVCVVALPWASLDQVMIWFLSLSLSLKFWKIGSRCRMWWRTTSNSSLPTCTLAYSATNFSSYAPWNKVIAEWTRTNNAYIQRWWNTQSSHLRTPWPWYLTRGPSVCCRKHCSTKKGGRTSWKWLSIIQCGHSTMGRPHG